MRTFGSVSAVLCGNRERLVRACGDELAASELIGFVQTMRRLLLADLSSHPLVSCSTALHDYLSLDLAGERSERVRLLFLDIKSRLIADETVFVGTMGSTTFSPREVIRRALELNASGLIIVHNHPSGDPTPSAADLCRTDEMVAAASLFGIDVVDHIVVAATGIVSILRPGAG